MGWNGSGGVVRSNGLVAGSDVWTADLTAGRKIRASLHDTHDEDLADAIQNCVAKDGQNTPTTNLPMGGYRHTGVGTATARSHYARADQVQDNSFIWGGTSGGSSSAYTVTLAPAPTAYTAGMMVAFIANHINTGASTLNCNALGAKNIRKNDGAEALNAGDIPASHLVVVFYDGTQFQLVSRAADFFETYVPSLGAGGSQTYTSTTVNYAYYGRRGNMGFVAASITGTTGGTPDPTLTMGLNLNATASGWPLMCLCSDGSNFAGTAIAQGTGITIRKYDSSNWGAGAGRAYLVAGEYLLA